MTKFLKELVGGQGAEAWALGLSGGGHSDSQLRPPP